MALNFANVFHRTKRKGMYEGIYERILEFKVDN